MREPDFFYEIIKDGPRGGRMRFQEEQETPARSEQLDFFYELTEQHPYGARMHFQSEPDFNGPSFTVPDPKVVEAELRAALPRIKRDVEKLEEASRVTRETLDLVVNI